MSREEMRGEEKRGEERREEKRGEERRREKRGEESDFETVEWYQIHELSLSLTREIDSFCRGHLCRCNL